MTGLTKSLVLAVACQLPGDEAYDMLKDDFIESFEKFYRNDCAKRAANGEQSLTVLDSLIQFTAIELPIICNVDSNIISVLRSKRSEIVESFIRGDMTDMITQLASRDYILESIRSFLKHENTARSMYRTLDSSRINIVFSDFLVTFRESSAHAFRFYGTFQNFVMNCFTQYYYRAHKRDIWAMLSSSDSARKEVEMSIVQEKVLKVERTDDVLIHDHLVNISVANDLMFRHTGQSESAYGTVYDIYYLMLCELCRERVNQINESIGYDLLEFVDDCDRKDTRLDQNVNKGIAAKITNGRELAKIVFNYLRDGNLSIASLSALREKCFQRGKHDREGRNCIWSDVIVGGETNRYLDTTDAHKNYSRFDKLLKGVVSTYTLMHEFESRSMHLVDSYNKALFLDKDIIRYMDYMSSLPYIGLIKELQNAPVDYSKYADDLFEFKQMLEAYAGSSVNNHTHIRENRYYAITHGFLVKPKLKQIIVPSTPFDKLKSLTIALEAVPRSWQELLSTLSESEYWERITDTSCQLVPSDVVAGKYNNLCFNFFFCKDEAHSERAAYYLSAQNSQVLDFCKNATSWSIDTSLTEGIYFASTYGLYTPLRDKVFLYDGDGLDSIPVSSMNEFIGLLSACKNQQFRLNFEPIHFAGFAEQYKSKICAAVRFNSFCGIPNLLQPAIQAKISAIRVASEYVPYLNLYYAMLAEASSLQHSLADIIKVMAVDTLYCSVVGDSAISDSDARVARHMLDGFTTGEFNKGSLQHILDLIGSVGKVMWPNPAGTSCALHQLDCSALNIVRGNTEGFDDPLGILKFLKPLKCDAERFLMLINFVYYALEYLCCFRDTLSFLLDAIPEEVTSLICELSERFRPLDRLLNYRDSEPEFGLRVTSQTTGEVKSVIMDFKWKLSSHFDSVLKDIHSFTQECEESISKLAPYSMSEENSSSSMLEEHGKAFNMLPAYPPTVHLNMLRQYASYDTSGFYMLGGKYFQGFDNGTPYYVHRTGRMVASFDKRLSIIDFNFGEEGTEKMYDSIIAAGLAANGYAI